jgi:hypothetical protein
MLLPTKSLPKMRRRNCLQSLAATVALPFFPSLQVNAANLPAGESAKRPKRLVCIGNEFGFYGGAFWPKDGQSTWTETELLKPLAPLAKHATLFGGLDHGLKGGHFAIHGYLTGVKATEAHSVENSGMSLDQIAAEHVGAATRFPSLTLGIHGGCMMSWSRSGTRVPTIQGPRELFRRLFLPEDAKSREHTEAKLKRFESILDSVSTDAKRLGRHLDREDRQKLDQYLTAVREVELKLAMDRHWKDIEKPKTELSEPSDDGLAHDLPKLYDLLALALQTDSTRVATIEVGGSYLISDLGIKAGYHAISHHGQVEATIRQLVQAELYQVQQYARFLEKLRSIPEPESDGTLLDHTMVMLGSGMGNANSHTNENLPIVVAGGGFDHGRYVQFPQDKKKRIPLCNLFVNLLQNFGMEMERFGTSTGMIHDFTLA